jgi:hypothetical protein
MVYCGMAPRHSHNLKILMIGYAFGSRLTTGGPLVERGAARLAVLRRREGARRSMPWRVGVRGAGNRSWGFPFSVLMGSSLGARGSRE